MVPVVRQTVVVVRVMLLMILLSSEPNLEFIKKYGKHKWLKVQEREWSCKSCGAEVKWYQRTCGCGRELDGWDVPV